MSIVSAGAKVLGKSIAALESEIEPGLRGVVKYMKRGGIIPSETSAGQLSFLPHGYGRRTVPRGMSQRELKKTVVRGAARSLGTTRSTSVPMPPFKSGTRFSGGDPRAAVTGLARRQELDQKAAAAAVRQQNAMDVARDAGQMTGQEWKRTNNILMMRRKRAAKYGPRG